LRRYRASTSPLFNRASLAGSGTDGVQDAGSTHVWSRRTIERAIGRSPVGEDRASVGCDRCVSDIHAAAHQSDISRFRRLVQNSYAMSPDRNY
jgi:hypothetical protein